MPASDTIYRATASSRPAGHAYTLRVDGRRGCERVRVAAGSTLLLEWQGDIARALIDALPRKRTAAPASLLGKSEVRDIALRAAAIEFAQHVPGARKRSPKHAALLALERRLDETSVPLSRARAVVALTLFRHPGMHLQEDDVVDLVRLDWPLLSDEQVRDAVDELVRNGICQRIAVDGLNFYDIDTTPHLHVYCPDKCELSDAPASGILRLSS